MFFVLLDFNSLNHKNENRNKMNTIHSYIVLAQIKFDTLGLKEPSGYFDMAVDMVALGLAEFCTEKAISPSVSFQINPANLKSHAEWKQTRIIC